MPNPITLRHASSPSLPSPPPAGRTTVELCPAAGPSARAVPAWARRGLVALGLAFGAGLAPADDTGSGAKPAPRPVAPAAAAPARGVAPLRSESPNAQPLDCMIQPSQVVQVGSPAPGVIEHILVDRGDWVTAGQPIVHLDASVERAALALARERAGQSGEVAATDGARELADREAARAEELYRKKFVSSAFRDKQQAEARVASGRSDEARERRRLAERELHLASAQYRQRTLRAPIAGVVVERHMALGEYVDQKPVLRIAAIDPLRVDVLVPASAFGALRPGMSGTVRPDLATRPELEATVKTVDRVIDAASNTFRVRLELANPEGRLPAGLRCKVDLPIGSMAVAAGEPSPSR